METAVLPAAEKRRISSVEFWRFVFTVMVSLYHFELFFIHQRKKPNLYTHMSSNLCPFLG